jgi:hypothetical protein
MYLDEPDPSNLSLTYKIGRRRLREFKSVLLLEFPYQDGYHIWMNRVEGKGIDIKVWKNGQLVVVMELTNYGRNSVINDKTVKRYLDSFAKYECKKILVVSYNQNISAKNEKQLIMQGIDLTVVGHQV